MLNESVRIRGIHRWGQSLNGILLLVFAEYAAWIFLYTENMNESVCILRIRIMNLYVYWGYLECTKNQIYWRSLNPNWEYFRIFVRSPDYRVATVFWPLFDFFSKNAIKKLVFHIFTSNFHRLFTGIWGMTLLEKITASLHYGLHMQPERPAGLRHDGPQEVDHHLHDLGHQWGGS